MTDDRCNGLWNGNDYLCQGGRLQGTPRALQAATEPTTRYLESPTHAYSGALETTLQVSKYRWASLFSLFISFSRFANGLLVFCFFVNKQTNKNFHLHGEQTVKGLRKIVWASVSVFCLKRQHVYTYRCRYIDIDIDL